MHPDCATHQSNARRIEGPCINASRLCDSSIQHASDCKTKHSTYRLYDFPIQHTSDGGTRHKRLKIKASTIQHVLNCNHGVNSAFTLKQKRTQHPSNMSQISLLLCFCVVCQVLWLAPSVLLSYWSGLCFMPPLNNNCS